MERSKKTINFRPEGPDPNSFEPKSINRASAIQDRGLLTGNRQQIESWAAQNSWRIGPTTWQGNIGLVMGEPNNSLLITPQN